MRRLHLSLLALLVAPLAHAVVPEKAARPAYVPGELIVKLHKHAAPNAAGWAALKLGAAEAGGHARGGLVTLRLGPGLSVEDAIGRLDANPDVEYAQPNYYRWRHAQCATGATRYCPNDPSFLSLQYALHYPFANDGDADMDLPEAWRLMEDDAGGARATDVLIAIIDDGFDLAHADLDANLRDGINCGPNPCSGTAAAQSGDETHGTQVAGSAAAVGNNGLLVASPVLTGDVYPIRLGLDGGGFTSETIIRAIDQAVAVGARVINLSLGGPGFSPAEFDAVDRARAAGVLVVASSGNSDANVDLAVAHYPANFALPNMLAVGASDAVDNMVDFSVWGSTGVDIAAAGSGVITTARGGGTSSPSGTSFSSPAVAGVAALIGQFLTDSGKTFDAVTSPTTWNYQELRARLLAGADVVSDNGDLGLRGRTATGRANARKSLDPLTGGVLVVQGVAYDDGAGLSAANDADGLPDPGETVNMQITLENNWDAAGTVDAVLSDPAGVNVHDTDTASGVIAAFGTGTVSFPMTFDEFTDIRQILFRLDLTPQTGAAQTRYFYVEVGELENGALISQQFGLGDFDEFHGWNVNVPVGATNFLVETFTDGGLDIDLIARRNARPEYMVELNTAGGVFAVFPEDGADAALLSAGADGDETIGSPSNPDTDVSDANSPGTWNLVAVNYVDTAHTYRVRASWDAAGAGTVRFNAETATVAESAGTLAIQVARSGGVGAVSVNYATAGGTAASGTDFTATAGTLNWANGDTAAKTVNIPILGDDLDETTENFTLTLSAPGGGADLGRFRTVTVSLTNSSGGGDSGGGGGGGGPFDPLALAGLAAILGFARRRSRRT